MSTLVDNRRGRMTRYLPWFARDYFTNQGPSTALVLLLVGFMAMQGAGGPAGFRQLPESIAGKILQTLLNTLVFLGTFFATNGIIANDRKQSYFRFLFSKPVSPLAYYSTVFVVYGAVLLVVTGALVALWAWTVRPMFPAATFAVVALMYVAYGGIGFLLSAAWRFDWMSLVTVLFVSNVLWDVWAAEEGVKRWVLHALPPVHRSDDVYAYAVAAAGDVPWQSVAWLGGYGLACFLLGLVVLRRRPLASS